MIEIQIFKADLIGKFFVLEKTFNYKLNDMRE